MARKTIFVSDLSGKAIDNDRDAVTITVKYGDARKGVIVVDAHPGDSEVKPLVAAGSERRLGWKADAKHSCASQCSLRRTLRMRRACRRRQGCEASRSFTSPPPHRVSNQEGDRPRSGVIPEH